MYVCIFVWCKRNLATLLHVAAANNQLIYLHYLDKIVFKANRHCFAATEAGLQLVVSLSTIYLFIFGIIYALFIQW